jgi:predicted enzyme related to lactoylglutathione lyase
MLKRDGYLPGVPCWVDTNQADVEAAAAFYSGLFGWEFENRLPPEAGQGYWVAQLHGGDVAAVTGGPQGTPTWNTYIWVDTADASAATVKAAGGQVLKGPFDVGDAGRMAVCADPDGAVFCLWEARGNRGAQVVNEPGTLNFNALNTRDLDVARAFYGKVFGWETLNVGDGIDMWRLAGYGDYLAQSDPEIRERIEASAAAPTGFEDVVATLVPLTPEHAEVPAHWSVTFAVDDADATAARAVELGGSVLVEPFDAPWVRMTILADPEGATFTASKFVPENHELAGHVERGAKAA